MNRSLVNLCNLEIIELLRLQASITNELKDRKVVRTQNNPLGDYTEWLVSKALNLQLAENSKTGYDGVTKEGVKIQIKGRRVTANNNSRQLSAIRKYDDRDFDKLAAVIFDDNFNILEAFLIPHEVIGDYANYRKHVNAHILILKGPILSDPRITSIKEQLATEQ
jgi:Family of unknown function (DUF6998)